MKRPNPNTLAVDTRLADVKLAILQPLLPKGMRIEALVVGITLAPIADSVEANERLQFIVR